MTDDADASEKLARALYEYLRNRESAGGGGTPGNGQELTSLIDEVREHLSQSRPQVLTEDMTASRGSECTFSNYGQNFGNYAQNFGNYAQNFGNYAQSLGNIPPSERRINPSGSTERRRQLQDNIGVPGRLPNGELMPPRGK